ncbi:MAG: two-component regulator propeller domain-containing protein [Bacteroidota bacterium]
MRKVLRKTILFLILSGGSFDAWNLGSGRLITGNNIPLVVRALLVDSQGIKWIGTDRGLYRYDNTSWIHYSESDDLAGSQVTALGYEDFDMGPELWVTTNRGVTMISYNLDGIIETSSYSSGDGLLDDSITSVVMDSHHRKYFGSASGISVFQSGSMAYLLYEENPLSMVDAPVENMHLHNDTLYVGSDGGIGRFVAGVDAISGATRWTNEFGITPLSDNIKSIWVDVEGHQWFGTDAGAEEHIGFEAKQNWLLYTTSEGLVDNHVLAITEDETGGMWFGTRGGISYLKDQTWTNYTTADGLASDTVYAIAVDPDGSVWFGTHRGLSHLEGLEFNNIFTDIPAREARGSDMTAWYNQLSREIIIRFHAQIPCLVMAELYSIEGNLLLRSNHSGQATGVQEIKFSPDQHGLSFPTGIYILRLRGEGVYGVAKVLVYNY